MQPAFTSIGPSEMPAPRAPRPDATRIHIHGTIRNARAGGAAYISPALQRGEPIAEMTRVP
jgi:hypothetical protein